jgi:hypothetical protein
MIMISRFKLRLPTQFLRFCNKSQIPFSNSEWLAGYVFFLPFSSFGEE